jgi:hypothetical protein
LTLVFFDAALVECLSLFGNSADPNSSTKLQMSTAGSGNDLVLLYDYLLQIILVDFFFFFSMFISISHLIF